MDIGVRLLLSSVAETAKHVTQKAPCRTVQAMTPSYINHDLLNGKKVPTLDALESLCSALSICRCQ